MDPGPTPRWACPECHEPLGWEATSPHTEVAAPEGGLTRVATWNLRECPSPGYAKGAEVARWQEKLSADIWLLTEVHREWNSSSGWTSVSPPRGGATRDTKRWAGIQTRLPMTELYEGPTDVPAAEESLCLARVQLPEGARTRSVLVACSVLPWGGAGKYWPGLPERDLNAQQTFVLGHHMARIDDAWDREEPLLWGGDFNQELRNLTPERKAAGYRIAGTVDGIERLKAAFDLFGLRPLTADAEHLNPEAPAIDHLAVSKRVARGGAMVHRPCYEDGRLLSDHAAYTADVAF
jgi:endonuclease/exonuclease/phosphatase family metal-dependent hydrolase